MSTKKCPSKKQGKLATFFSHHPAKIQKNESRSTLGEEYGNSTRTKKRRIGQHGMRQSGFMECPMCHRSYPIHRIEAHAVECNGNMQGNHGSINGEDTDRVKRHKSSKLILSNDQSLLMTSDNINRNSCSMTSSASKTKLQWRQLLNGSKTSSVDFMPLEDCIEPMCEPIPGLFLFENFINETEEGVIINELDGTNTHDAFKDSVEWKTSNFNGLHEGKRWGVHCNLRDRRVYKEENPLPNFIVNILLPKLRRLKCMKGCIPNEANAINYRKRRGDYLKSHVDDRQLSKEAIINLSIAGDCLMTFKNEKQASSEMKKVLLKRGTLQVLTGKSRYDYSHGILNSDLLSERRISVTMRESPLTCKQSNYAEREEKMK